MDEKFFVAVDGGGTGTRVRAYLPNRTLLGEGQSGASSLTLGVELAWGNIRKGIEDAVQHTSFSGQLPSCLVAGLAGSRNPKQQQALMDCMESDKRSQQIKVHVVSDAYTSALGALSGQAGIVVAIGTGLGACAINADFQPRYVSGWGFKVGDEGAGSWIGLQAVQAFLKRMDGRDKGESNVYALVGNTLGTTVSAIQQWCLRASATDFARFAKPIVQLAGEGDVLAIAIMQKAADEVVQVIQAFDEMGEQAAIVLLGGLGQAMQVYLPDTICERLQPPKGTSLDGATAILFDDYPVESP